jgi:ribonuclease P protein component
VKRCYSLKGRDCFSAVIRQGRRFKVPGIQLFVLKKCEHECRGLPDAESGFMFKAGIIISRKFGKAHVRNLYKRRVRAILQGVLPEIESDCCVVFRLFEEMKTMDYVTIEKEITVC